MQLAILCVSFYIFFNFHSDYPVTYCPLNMIYGTCTCQPSCSYPDDTNGCISNCENTESCICAEGFLKKEDECVLPNECGCYVADINQIIPVSNNEEMRFLLIKIYNRIITWLPVLPLPNITQYRILNLKHTVGVSVCTI